MTPQQDPVILLLHEIRAKQDQTLRKQEQLEKILDEVRDDCEKTARTNGAVAGAVSGGVVSVGIMLVKAKLGL